MMKTEKLYVNKYRIENYPVSKNDEDNEICLLYLTGDNKTRIPKLLKHLSKE